MASRRTVDLVNKPLVEAIFELKWELTVEHGPGVRSDPNYSVLPGLFWSEIREQYPFRETLPAASLPPEMVAHQPQHRFRTEDGGWPLVQLGPGLVTVNDTEGYTWSDFRGRCLEVVTAFCSAYPDSSALRPIELALTYQDAHRCDFRAGSVLAYMKEYLHTGLTLPKGLFTASGVDEKPLSSDWSVSFASSEPAGTVSLRFATGFRNQTEPVVITETKVQSGATQVPPVPDGFAGWLKESHDLTHDWFFTLIKGKLREVYEGKET